MLSNTIDRMAEIKRLQAALKLEYAGLEGELLKAAAGALKNTKQKSVAYYGANGAKATATMADSIKVQYPSMLKRLFGDAYKDVATEKVTVSLSAPATRMLTAIWREDYTKDSFKDILTQLPVDDGTREVLAKKLRGINFVKDKERLVEIGKLDEETAEEYAYFLSEAAAWEDFLRLLSASGKPSDAQIATALDLVNGAIIVEETPKITMEVGTDAL